MGEGYQPSAQPPTWRASGITLCLAPALRPVLVLVSPQEYKTPANIALGVTGYASHPTTTKGQSQARQVPNNSGTKSTSKSYPQFKLFNRMHIIFTNFDICLYCNNLLKIFFDKRFFIYKLKSSTVYSILAHCVCRICCCIPSGA